MKSQAGIGELHSEEVCAFLKTLNSFQINQNFVLFAKVECVAPYDELDWVNMGRVEEGARYSSELNRQQIKKKKKTIFICFFVDVRNGILDPPGENLSNIPLF